MATIPILKLEDFLVVSVQTELHDRQAVDLQTRILEELRRTRAKGVLIDVTSLDVVDSFVGRMIEETSSMGQVLGANVVLVGLRPAVAITMVELGLQVKGVRTALNLEKGLALMRDCAREQEE